MKKRALYLFVVCTFVFLTSCDDTPVPNGQWVPSLEDTGFGYLKDEGIRIKNAVQSIKTNLAEGKRNDALAAIVTAEEELKELVYYDIPITEARQLIYDASRLHALNRKEDSKHHLARAETVLNAIAAHGNAAVVDTLKGPHTMIDELQFLLEQEQRMTSPKDSSANSLKIAGVFKALGHQVNMMALKSDLLLSGAHFAD